MSLDELRNQLCVHGYAAARQHFTQKRRMVLDVHRAGRMRRRWNSRVSPMRSCKASPASSKSAMYDQVFMYPLASAKLSGIVIRRRAGTSWITFWDRDAWGFHGRSPLERRFKVSMGFLPIGLMGPKDRGPCGLLNSRRPRSLRKESQKDGRGGVMGPAIAVSALLLNGTDGARLLLAARTGSHHGALHRGRRLSMWKNLAAHLLPRSCSRCTCPAPATSPT